jgi:hypothetical protein
MGDPSVASTDAGDTESAVAARLRRLDTEGAARLVADLWAGRGYETGRNGAVVTARRGGRTTRVGVVPARRLRRPAPPADADTLVCLGDTNALAAGGEPGVRVLGATDLAEMLLYAVDRPESRRLCERHLGAPPSALRPPLGLRLRRYARSARGLLPGATTVLFVAAAVGATLALALGGSGPGTGPGAPAGAAPVPTNPLDGATGPTDAVSRSGVTTTTGTVVEDFPPGVTASMPPGLTPAGIGDIALLGRAHDQALAGTSYRLTLERRRPADPGNASSVARDDRYLRQALLRPGVTRTSRFRIDGDRYLLNATLAAANGSRSRTEVYHNGTDWFVASNLTGATTYRRSGVVETAGVDPTAFRRLLVRQYLSTPDTRVTGILDRENGTRYRVVGSGTPLLFPPDLVENYTVVALIDGRGVVRHLSADYRVLDDGREFTVQVEVSHSGFGETTVPEPPWFPPPA